MSFEAMLTQRGQTWARKTMPYAGSALITDVVRVNKTSYQVVFDEASVKGYKVEGLYFQKHYQPVAASGRAAVPQFIHDALAAYERAVQTCSRGIAGTAQYNHLLSIQNSCKEQLLRAIADQR